MTPFRGVARAGYNAAGELLALESRTDHFLSDYAATEVDEESALGKRGNGIHTGNITAASRVPVHDSFTYLHARCAKMLAANDFGCFSVVARHPRTILGSGHLLRRTVTPARRPRRIIRDGDFGTTGTSFDAEEARKVAPCQSERRSVHSEQRSD